MNRAVRIVGILGCLLLMMFALWTARTRSVIGPKPETLEKAIQSAVTNPLGFAKSHFTGGIGAVLLVDPVMGIPQVHNVMAGSPAEKAGLRDGDPIVQIDGVATNGRT